MKQEVKIGQTDYTVLILIRDSTTGAPKTGLTNASAGIDVCYVRVETDNDVTVTAGAPVALATPALTDPHLDWGFLEVDATNAPGLYRLDLADGVFATGAWSAVVSLICTGCDPVHIEFVLVAYDKTDGVRLGLTALPAAAADTAGGLPISDAGGLDLDAKLANTNEVTAARMGALTDLIDGGRLDLLVDAIKTATDKLGYTGAGPYYVNAQVKAQDNIDFGALQKASLNAATPASVANIPVDGSLKVDIEKIKTQAVTCAAGVTVLPNVGFAGAPGANNGAPTTNGTKLNQTVDLTAGQSIACSDKTGFSLAATGADLILKSSTFVQAIVAAINEFATYGLTALNTLLTSTGIKTATTAAPTDMATATNQTTLLNRIGAFTGSGVNTILGFFKALMGKAASNPSDLGALTFDAATDSVESIREASDTIDGNVDAIVGYVDTEVASILAAVDTEVATLVSELAKVPKSDGTVVLNATALASIKTALEAAGSHLALIKAKSDKLTFTSGNDLDANIQKVNDVTLTGNGTVGTPWGPA